MTRILQLTDTHIVAAPDLVSGRVDTRAFLTRAVERLEEVLVQVAPVDLLLVTGDLTDFGRDEDYRTFREILAPLAHLPLAVIPGNHDLRAPMRRAFRDLPGVPAEGPLDWLRDLGMVRVIGLDTLVEGASGGRLLPESLEFLRAALAGAGDRAVLVALHHPPFATGIRFMDAIGLANAGEFAAILAPHRGRVRIVAGHAHCTALGEVAGIPALIGPSVAHGFAPDLRAEAPVGYYDETGGFLLHDWTGAEWRSTRIGLETPVGPWPF